VRPLHTAPVPPWQPLVPVTERLEVLATNIETNVVRRLTDVHNSNMDYINQVVQASERRISHSIQTLAVNLEAKLLQMMGSGAGEPAMSSGYVPPRPDRSQSCRRLPAPPPPPGPVGPVLPHRPLSRSRSVDRDTEQRHSKSSRRAEKHHR